MTKTAILSTISTFHIKSFHFDAKIGVLTLPYGLDNHVYFEETITFPALTRTLTKQEDEALQRLFLFLQIAAGVSYYKTCVPPHISVESGAIDDETAAFFRTFYQKGLAEFAYRNQLDLSDKLIFSYEKTNLQPYDLPLPEKTVALFGGGKDSLVSTELLKTIKSPLSLFIVNSKPEIEASAAHTGLPLLHVTRKLSPNLFELNAQGALNGHVPITGILSFIAACSAILQGFNTIVMSNERSANEGNLAGAPDVNHQYSKSFSFEKNFSTLIKSKISSNLSYFSLLRPFSELLIAKIFSKSTTYDNSFTSCNANFRINNALKDKNWCCNCPKCRFSFLIFAVFMPKERLIAIFGENMLDNAAQLAGFAELLGFSDNKPWECVGEFAESAAALFHLTQQPEWQHNVVVKTLGEKLGSQSTLLEKTLAEHLMLSGENLIPQGVMTHVKTHVA